MTSFLYKNSILLPIYEENFIFFLKIDNFYCYILNFMIIYLLLFGGIGEVVNTPDCGSGMQGFDPLIPPQIGKKSKDLVINSILMSRFFLFGSKKMKYLVIKERIIR